MAPAIVRAGVALYGPQWRNALARDLGVSDRTLRRWVAGTINPPATLHKQLADIIDLKIKGLRAALHGLHGECADEQKTKPT